MSTADARRPIFLIGMPGAGKTTLGRALASAGIARYVDLDDEVESLAGMSVGAIFSTLGEAEFRRMEAETLGRLCALPDGCGLPLVVGCGGGTPCNPHAMAMMTGAGVVVWLQASRERLLRRLYDGRHKRPKIAGLDLQGIDRYIDQTTRARVPFYSRATRVFDSTFLENEAEIAATTARFAEEIITQQHI